MNSLWVVIQVFATGVIAFFAWRSWKATNLYAQVAGLTLLVNAVGGAAGLRGDVWIDLLKLLRKKFPKESKMLEKHMPAGAKSDSPLNEH